jgi:hypothetical protein
MAGLESLSPARQAQYEALLPEIERSVRNAQNARGGFYSGEATAAETRAKADLLAKLASQDASEQASSNESARDRALTEKIKGEEIKAGKRNVLLGILGTGVGAAATLGGLKYMNPSGGNNLVPLGNGKFGMFDPATKTITPIAETGAGAVSARAPIDLSRSATNPNLFADPNSAEALIAGDFGPMPPAVNASPAAPAVAAPTSMWKPAIAPTNLAAGAAGGGLGYLASRSVNGGGSTAGDVGAGVGGAGGYMGGLALANKFGWSNPWAAGLGALAGSFGGGLLGNLFK